MGYIFNATYVSENKKNNIYIEYHLIVLSNMFQLQVTRLPKRNMSSALIYNGKVR